MSEQRQFIVTLEQLNETIAAANAVAKQVGAIVTGQLVAQIHTLTSQPLEAPDDEKVAAPPEPQGDNGEARETPPAL